MYIGYAILELTNNCCVDPITINWNTNWTLRKKVFATTSSEMWFICVECQDS